MKQWLCLLLGLLFFSFSSQKAACAENDLSEYDISIFDANSGLTSSEITSIVQTKDEYIWVGSYSGLFHYNGNQFGKFEGDSRLNTITALYADTQNRLWIGTNSNGVACYEPDTQKIRFYTVRDGMTSDSVRCITEDGQKNIYVGTTNYLSIITAENEVRSPFSSQRISSIDDLAYSSKEDCIAGVTNTGDLFYVKKQRNIAKISYKENPGEYFRCISTSAQGVFLVGTSENTVCTAKYIHNKIVYSPIFTIPHLSYINDIIPDRIEKGMFICAENGVVHYTNNGKTNNLSPKEFSNTMIDALRDVQGNIWLASSQKGICKLSSNPFSDIFKKANTEPTIVNSIIKVNHDLYIGSDSGLIIIDEENNIQKKNKLTRQLEGMRIRHIMQDSKQNLWISTYSSSGLYCVSKDQKITLFNESTGTQGGLFCYTLELQDGTILAVSNTGLTYIKDGVIDAVLGQDNGLSTPQILCATQTADGTIYAGSGGGGVYMIKNKQVKERIHTPDGLENKIISRIAPVDNGLLYITTNEIYYHKGNTIRKLENLPYNNCYDIHVTGGQAWISSSVGIFVIPVKDFLEDKGYNYILLDKSRGLDSSLTSNAWNFAEGRKTYYICCDDGVKKCDFANIASTPSNIKLGIDEIIINDKIPLHPIYGTYQIPADATHISIQPMALNYTLSNPLIHMYMEGFDEQGITQRQHQINNITYANLTYGNYKFHMQILDESGHILQDTVIHIKKDAQFFEHLYFRIYLFIFCALIIAFFAWMVARLASISIIRQQMKATQSARQEAERANNAKTLFLTNMSHEIRTPINAIMGMDELILRQKISPEVQKYATDIRNAGNTLLAIVNDILDFSKIESGKMNVVDNNYKTEQLLQDVVAILQIRAKEKNLLSKIILDQNIPKELLGDETKIKQILTNLVSNAIKYTEKGSVTFRAALVSIENHAAWIEFSVADTGIGIKESELGKLFETFERLDEKRNAKVQGTGLGLSITKQLLELMGSAIKVESEYNKGSTFSFVLKQTIINPAPIGNINTLFSINKTEPVHSTNFSAPDAKILVVDDNTMNLTVIEGLLEPTNIQIDTAISGKACLEMIQKKHYDIIFLDHMMPNMDGIETLAHIKETEHLCKEVPIIILTANAIQGAKEMYLKKGFTDYLSKPVSSTKLEAVIQKYLPQDLLRPITVEFSEENDTAKETNSENNLQATSTDYIELCEINWQAGLSINDNLEPLYRKLLTLFYDTGEEKIAEICDAYQKENWKDYKIYIHALKSSAKSLGAVSLSDEAKALEFAAGDSDIDYIREHHDNVIALYHIVMEECHQLLTAPSADIPIIQKKKKGSYTTQDTFNAIKNLQSAIAEHDRQKANEQLKILLSVAFPMRKVSLLEKLQFSIENSDWNNAKNLMKKL